MTGMREDLERKLHHQQPRDRRVDHTTPGGFVPPRDPVCPTCEGAGEVCTNPDVYLFNPAAVSFTSCPNCDGTGERSTP